MHKSHVVLALVAVFLPNLSARAQVRQLKIEKTVSVPGVPAVAILSPIKCDSDGNIVLRAMGGPDVDDAPITVVSQDGRKLASYHLSNLAEPKKSSTIDYAHERGTLYVLERDQKAYSWILRYGDDGTLKSSFALDPDIDAMQIEVTSSSDLFVAGRSATPGPTGLPGSFFGIYSTNGQLLRRIEPLGDIKPAPTDSGTHEFERAVRGSLAKMGRDGNLYLMRFAAKGPVFLITPSGTTKKIVLSGPEGAINSGMLAVGSGRFAVQFLKFKADSKHHEIASAVIQIVDSDSGQISTTIQNANEIGAGLACYDGQTFVFVRTDDTSHLQIVKARPE